MSSGLETKLVRSSTDAPEADIEFDVITDGNKINTNPKQKEKKYK